MPFILFKDSSEVVFSDILSQNNKNIVDYPIAYYSETPFKSERNYRFKKREHLEMFPAIK